MAIIVGQGETVEFYGGNGAANQTSTSNTQPADATLTALAALNASAGLLEQTGADAFTKRPMGVSASTDVLTRADGDLRYASISVTGYTDEQAQDAAGAMVTGNTELGISVTYDDAANKLNFDAQTAGDARYAPIAKGVTNGDSHDHNGGDGAQINHTTLSNIGTNTHAQIDTHIASTSNPHSVTKSQVGLGSVENTALSTWAGSANITTLGTIGTGTWNATTIAANKGGTGQASYTKGDILVASASTTLTKLAVGSNGQVLVADSTQTTGTKWANAAGPVAPTAKTSDYTIVAADHGRTFTNAGAGDTVILTLPTWAAGLKFSFIVAEGLSLRILRAGSNTIFFGGTDNAQLDSATVGAFISIEGGFTGAWVVTSAVLEADWVLSGG